MSPVIKKSVSQFAMEAFAFFGLTFILSFFLTACSPSAAKEVVKQSYQDALIACVGAHDTPKDVQECWVSVDKQFNVSTDAGVNHD